MASIRFSATSTASAATSITVSLGGTPTSGDLVLVFLGTDNEIVVHQPGYATTNTWFPLDKLRSADSATLQGWRHTWNASDSGSSVTFTFTAASTLGVGDKDLSTVNAVAIAVVMTGPTTAMLEHTVQGCQPGDIKTNANPLRKASAMAFQAAYTNGSTGSLSDSDGSAVSVATVTLASGLGQSLALWRTTSPAAGYAPTFTGPNPSSPMVQAVSVSDSTSQVYNPPFVEEGPVAYNELHYRYKLSRFYTVLNNTGTFTAQRYLSTDQFNAATQTFVNNQTISTTDRTNLLAAGVGGDYQATA